VLTGIDALRERPFRLLFLGQATSAFGSALMPVALAFAVLDLSRSPAGLGFVIAASRLPQVLFVLVGGVAGDRCSRRLVMLASDAVRFATQGAGAALLLAGHARLWELAALQLVNGSAAAFFNPAATALIPETVTPARLQQANALMGLSRSSTGVVAQVVSGVLVATVGPGVTFAIDSATFVASAVSLALLPASRGVLAADRRSFLHDLVEGWEEFRSRSWLWVGTSYVALLNTISLAPFFLLGPIVCKQSLGGAGAWAAIGAAFAAGMMAGGALAVRWQPRRPLIACFAVVFAAAPELALLALRAPAPAVAVATFAGGAQASFFIALWATVLQQNVPRHALSRVASYDSLGALVLVPISYPAAGALAAWLGVGTVLWFGVGWLVLTTAVVLSLPAVRALEQPATQPVEAPSVLAPDGAAG
jgi:Major Facilitator Superfamily